MSETVIRYSKRFNNFIRQSFRFLCWNMINYQSICTSVQTLNNSASYHLQNDFFLRNNWNQMLVILLFYLALLLALLSVLMLLSNFAIFLLRSEYFTRLEISDLLINLSFFISTSSISRANLL